MKKSKIKLSFAQVLIIATLIVIGLMTVGLASYQAGFSQEIVNRDCGFFAHCGAGHAKEKIEITKFKIVNPGTVIASLTSTLLVFSLALVSKRVTASNKPAVIIGAVWLIGLVIVLITAASTGSAQNGRERLLGALNDEEYACQLKAVKSLNTLPEPPATCPSSPLSEAYFQLDQ